jgi:hypothetical protein
MFMTSDERIAIGHFIEAAQRLLEGTKRDLANTDQWRELARTMNKVAVIKSEARQIAPAGLGKSATNLARGLCRRAPRGLDFGRLFLDQIEEVVDDVADLADYDRNVLKLRVLS